MKKLLLTIKGDRTLSNIEIKETGNKIKNFLLFEKNESEPEKRTLNGK